VPETHLILHRLYSRCAQLALGARTWVGAIDAMKDTDTNAISSQAVAELRARMRTCLDEIDRLGLSAIAPHMDYAIARLDAAYPEAVVGGRGASPAD